MPSEPGVTLPGSNPVRPVLTWRDRLRCIGAYLTIAVLCWVPLHYICSYTLGPQPGIVIAACLFPVAPLIILPTAFAALFVVGWPCLLLVRCHYRLFARCRDPACRGRLAPWPPRPPETTSDVSRRRIVAPPTIFHRCVVCGAIWEKSPATRGRYAAVVSRAKLNYLLPSPASGDAVRNTTTPLA